MCVRASVCVRACARVCDLSFLCLLLKKKKNVAALCILSTYIAVFIGLRSGSYHTVMGKKKRERKKGMCSADSILQDKCSSVKAKILKHSPCIFLVNTHDSNVHARASTHTHCQ